MKMYYFYGTYVKESIKYLGVFRHTPSPLGDTEKNKFNQVRPGF